jgi:hypothetical protein
MRALRLLVPAVLALLAGARPAAAQAGTPEQEVRAVIDGMFNAMRTGDSTAFRRTMHPEARLMSVGVRQGTPMLRSDSIEAFVRAVGTPRNEVWDERISNVEIRVDGELATAWMDYAFYRGDQFSHCGVNAFQLFRSAEGWKVINITDTRRRECPRIGARPAAQ